MPALPRGQTAAELFGSCDAIAAATVDDPSVVATFPPDSWFTDDAAQVNRPPPTLPRTWWAVGAGVGSLVALSALIWGCWCKTAASRRWHERSGQTGSRSTGGQQAYAPVGYGSIEMAHAAPPTHATTPQGV